MLHIRYSLTFIVVVVFIYLFHIPKELYPASKASFSPCDLYENAQLGSTPREYVFEGAIQYFAGQRHRLLKLKTQATLNWFSTRAR